MTPPKVPIKVYGNCVVTEMIRAEFPEPMEVNLDLQPDLQPFRAAAGGNGFCAW
jgi:hypothetical protein